MRSAPALSLGPPEGAAAPASCRLSVTQPPTPPPLPIGRRGGPGPFQLRLPRMDRPGGRGRGGRVRPAVSYGGGPAGGRAGASWLTLCSLARAPSRRLWGSRGSPSGRRYSLAPTSSQSFPGSVPPSRVPPSTEWPRRRFGESPGRRRVVFKPC